jgi:hypothetical protein
LLTSVVNTRDPDIRAFAKVMQHIREFDIHEHTVIMMQVGK